MGCAALQRIVLRLLLFAAAACTACAAGADEPLFEQLYGELLHKYWHAPVIINGVRTTVLDYAALAADAEQPDSLFQRTRAALEQTDVVGLGYTEAAEAFWINVHNFAAISLVVDHYPVSSIRSMKISIVKYPWSKTAVKIRGHGYSLNEIERDMLLARFKDRRVVLAIGCIAVSCPDLMPDPVTGEHLDAQLDELARRFCQNRTKGVALDRADHVLRVSWLFRRKRGQFHYGAGDVAAFVMPYLIPEDREWLESHSVELEYMEQDWTLNDLALAQPETP